MVLDGATLDRFFVVTIGYDEIVELNSAKAEYFANGGTDEQTVTTWVSYVQDIRERVEKAGLLILVTPRASIDGARLLAAGLDKKIVKEGTVFKHMSTDQKRQLEIS